MKKKRIFGLAGIAAVVLAAGAGIYYTTSHHGSKGNSDLKVVTSFYPVYEFTKQVVGDEGEVSYLIPAGSEAHDFQPSTKNVADIEKADTFVYLNENMETWVPKVEKSINTKNTKIIKASQGMVLLPGIEEEDHDHGGEEHHHEYDPHVWLSPKRSQKLVETIRDGLIAQHPDKKAVFTTNAEKYLKKLKTLDKEYTEALSQAKQKSFVTQHSAFAYLALDYGLTQVPISGVSAESDPSAKRIASLSKYVKEYDINYIYFEENASSSVAKTLANEVGVKTAVLNPIESLTKEQLKKGEDYVSVMTENLKNLRLTTDVEGKAIQPETGSRQSRNHFPFYSDNCLFRTLDALCRGRTDPGIYCVHRRSAASDSTVCPPGCICVRWYALLLCVCQSDLCNGAALQAHWKSACRCPGHPADPWFFRNLSDRDDTGLFPETASASAVLLRNWRYA